MVHIVSVFPDDEHSKDTHGLSYEGEVASDVESGEGLMTVCRTRFEGEKEANHLSRTANLKRDECD